MASHMCHEANAESTFSLSGSLSNSNTHTDPSFLSTMVRINKNKVFFNPTSEMIFKAYRSKVGNVPDEDAELQCETEGGDEEGGAESDGSDEGAEGEGSGEEE